MSGHQRKNSTSSVINPSNGNSLSLSFLHKKRHSDSSIENNTNTPNTLSTSNSTSSIPKLVRKKSGELVKSNLKLNCMINGALQSKSMPTTPLYNKSVHFGQDVDVRYFNELDKPTAVSANTSPILKGRGRRGRIGHMMLNGGNDKGNNFGNEYRYGYGLDYDYDYDSVDETSSDSDDGDFDDDGFDISWDLEMVNFEKIKYNEKIHQQKSRIFLERINIDEADDCISGYIAVKNVSFEKKVHIRYTFDHWRTVIEIESFYINENIPKILKRANYDRFIFKIPLKSFRFMEPDQIKVFFCIRYRFNPKDLTGINEQEIWDNNDYKNYEINLIKSKRKRYNKKNNKFLINDYLSGQISINSNRFKNGNNHDHGAHKNTNDTFSFNNNNLSQLDSYFNNYELLRSPETPKVLKPNNKNGQSGTNGDLVDEDVDKSIDDLNLHESNEQPISPQEDYFNTKKSLFTGMDPASADPLTQNNYSITSAKPNESTNTTNEVTIANTNTNNNTKNNDNINFKNDTTNTTNNNNKTQNIHSIAKNFNLNRNHKPMINSKSYQELLDSYCFFKSDEGFNKPSTISSYLDETLNKH